MLSKRKLQWQYPLRKAFSVMFNPCAESQPLGSAEVDYFNVHDSTKFDACKDTQLQNMQDIGEHKLWEEQKSEILWLLPTLPFVFGKLTPWHSSEIIRGYKTIWWMMLCFNLIKRRLLCSVRSCVLSNTSSVTWKHHFRLLFFNG